MSLVSLELDTAELAQQYDRISAERQFRVGQLLIRDLALQPGESVLDIGSGTGLLAEHAAGIVGPGGPVIGIDPLPLRVEIAQHRARPNLVFRTGNAYDLGEFGAESFDAVYMNAVFHWLEQKEAALRQVMRILKRGGRLGISTGSRTNSNPLHRVKERVLSRPPYNRYVAASGPVAFRINLDEMRDLLNRAGFQIGGLELRHYPRRKMSPDEAIEFSQASSFGNFLGHLPDELQAIAREDIKRELERIDTQASTSLIAATAIKP